MQETRVLVETRGTTGEETISYWFDLPIDVAEFEEKLGIGAESGDYRIIEKVLPYADEVHEHTSVYQLNELDFMYRQLSSDMQEEYVSLLTVFENLEALYICRNVIIVYPDCKIMIDVARQKLMNDPMFKHLSEPKTPEVDASVDADTVNDATAFLETFFKLYPTATEKELAYYVAGNVIEPIGRDYLYSELVNPIFTKDGDNVKVKVAVKFLDNQTKATQVSQYELVLHKDSNWKIVG